MRSNKEYRKLVGDRIKKARKEKEWSQEKLAEEVGVSRISIIRIEKGKRDTGIFTYVKIAKALELTNQELFDE